VRIFTWHVHGNYLYYLSQGQHEFYLPVRDGRPHPYGGRGTTFPFGENVHEVAAEEVSESEFDCVLFQSRANFLEHQQVDLSPAQQRLPRIYLEHDPPREHPTDTRHCVTNSDVRVVHVTNFNRLMWDNGDAPTRVIEHGVLVPEEIRYEGDTPRGLVVINNIGSRGRRLGLDVFLRLRESIPLDIVGMGSEEAGGLGEIPPMELPDVATHYRFLLNPIRYTSLGLAVCEAMSIGLPVLGLATCEMPSVISNGVNGYIETDPERLIGHARRLIDDREAAMALGANARRLARERFGIGRFLAEWDEVFSAAVGGSKPAVALEEARA